MFGNIKEYKVLEITKKVFEKKKWSLDEFDSSVMDEINETLNNDGLVLALGRKVEKNKIVKGVYIFKKEIRDDENIITFDKNVFVEEIREEIVRDFENAVDDYLGAVVSEQQAHRAFFRDKEFELKKVKVGKYELSSTLLWILWGVITWVLTQDVMWLCLGVVFGSSCGYAVKVNGKAISVNESKKKKKKESKKNNRKKTIEK